MTDNDQEIQWVLHKGNELFGTHSKCSRNRSRSKCSSEPSEWMLLPMKMMTLEFRHATC
jgi:hypothetical protein